MSAITLDRTILEKLPMLHESTEICDEEGKVLGVFTPAEETCHKQAIPRHLLDKFDAAEIERRSQSKDRGRTTAEVLRRLEEMETAP